MGAFMTILGVNYFDVLTGIIVLTFTILMSHGNASAAATGLSFEASRFVGVVANRNRPNQENTAEPITIKADLASEPRVVRIDVNDFVKDKKVNKAFSDARCYSRILESRYDLVDWLNITDSNLQRTLWNLYTRSRKILYKVNGFYSGPLLSLGERYLLDCFYSDIHLTEKILEEKVFDGAIKILKNRKR